MMEYKKIANVSKNLQQNNLETITNQIDKEIYISPEKRQNVIDNLRSIIIV